jgi:hypothetical protein
MRHREIAIALLFPLGLLACGKATTGTDMAGKDMPTSGDMTTSPDLMGAFPVVPVLGKQIDRMGRPGINTALTNPFALPLGPLMNMTSDQTKDAYNQGTGANDPTQWATTYAPEIAINLAIYDGLDGTCGNQVGFSAAMNYTTLAGALADDELYVNTASTTCKQYLGVELAALSMVAPTDCGGRTPLENTIDVTYSALVTGMASGVTNGITSSADGNANTTTFPFLGAPN